jgi:cytochrome c oxidase accessory protein FixG
MSGKTNNMAEYEEIYNEEDEQEFRNRIATVNESGKRIWLYPKKPKGVWYNRRKLLSYFFLAFLFAAPHIKIGGEQLLLFNILERKFIIFGKIFWPQDMFLFAIALIIGVVAIILFTIIYGRLFCGWVCPQTIFMEMVFRRIEYWIEGDWTHQRKLNEGPWNKNKILKKVAKHTLFWIISFLIANTFLAYIIGSDALWQIQTDPVNTHIGGLISIIIFTTVFYLVFARLREQVCTTICPYGRLQGVLLDQNSMVVAYDHKRGEERAKFKKNEDRAAVSKGDCIDCNQCVNVCPTGIDIRNGTQLECVNCTACIDACDHMMDSVGLEKGLIRFVSEKGINERTGFQWTRRVKSYTVLLIGMMGVLIALLITRSDFEATIFRQRGSTFQMLDDGRISNIFEINLTNKTKKEFHVSVELEEKIGDISVVIADPILKKEGYLKERMIIKLPLHELKNGKREVNVLIKGNGELIKKVKAKVIGPLI